jgi:hypothetical protein
MINWDVSSEDMDTIIKIVDRAVGIATTYGKKSDINRRILHMDIQAVHANGCPLDLQGLAIAQHDDFVHDVWEIRRQIDRSTGQLQNCFVPRYAKANHEVV